MKDKSLKSLKTIRDLNRNTRNALVKGVLVGIFTAIIYLTVVIITTPNLPANTAINAAFKVNGIIITGLSIGIGIQVFTSIYSKGLGCRLDDKRKYDQKDQQCRGIRRVFRIGGRNSSSSGGSTVISSFLSFFSLVPLGCCGSWLFILSMLPSIFGGTISVILIEYSTLLSYVGLIVVIGFAALSVIRLRKELSVRTKLGRRKLSFSDNKTFSTLGDKLGERGRGGGY
jgi:hypothetical protein